MSSYSTQTVITGYILEDEGEFTLADLCRACAAESTMVVNLVEEGILAPVGDTPERWRFSGIHMHRARRAMTLQRDLGVNLQGAALAIELLEELESLRMQLRRLSHD